LMAEAQLDPAFEEPFRAWVQSRRAVVLAILARGRERGEIAPDADLDLAVDQLFGAFWYRLLVGHLTLKPSAAAAHVAQLLRGLAPAGPPTEPKPTSERTERRSAIRPTDGPGPG